VKADWIVPLPNGLSEKQAMAVGTAGFTAMIAVMALEEHGLKPGGKPVIVTGQPVVLAPWRLPSWATLVMMWLR
jgi:hypothetical protein